MVKEAKTCERDREETMKVARHLMLLKVKNKLLCKRCLKGLSITQTLGVDNEHEKSKRISFLANNKRSELAKNINTYIYIFAHQCCAHTVRVHSEGLQDFRLSIFQKC